MTATPITSDRQIRPDDPAFHMHCIAGCGKSAGFWAGDGVLRCTDCKAPFAECSPAICNLNSDQRVRLRPPDAAPAGSSPRSVARPGRG